MATLILTAVGSAIGGPIGGLLGSIAGQQIDQNILFKPKRREGPRLQELDVQTSTYGTQIPKIYGRMRVAGTVVWATELKERRNSEGGGKGSPGATTFSYSACFAVALSCRHISEVRRIWADGKLLRGMAGDFKTPVGFNFHSGSENQQVDRLINGHEGENGSPAYRGLALAVFEDMELADYGNRIPSLTFELVADNGDISIGDIINDLSENRITAEVDDHLVGFSAYGNDTRDALRAIGDTLPFSIEYRPGSSVDLVARDRNARLNDSPARLTKSAYVRGPANSSGQAEIRSAPASLAPRQLSLRYYDPARDYQAGMQNAFRSGHGRVVASRELPAAIDAVTARDLCDQLLHDLDVERTNARLQLPLSGQDISPGKIVNLDGETGLWRILEAEYHHNHVEIALSRTGHLRPSFGLAIDEGRSLPDLDRQAGATRLVLVDLPFALGAPLVSAETPQVYVAAAGGTGWRTAELFKSDPQGAPSEPIAQLHGPARIGTVQGVLDTSSASSIDMVNQIDVQMHADGMDLFMADFGALIGGKNLAAVGSEIIQFSSAVPLGENRFRLSGFLRGLGGSEAKMSQHVPEEDFVMLDNHLLTRVDSAIVPAAKPLTLYALGRDDREPVMTRSENPGRSLRPWSPAHPRGIWQANGDLLITWVRRSRDGLQWSDFVDVPLAESFERYHVSIEPDGLPENRQLIETGASEYLIPRNQLDDIRSSGSDRIVVKLQQLGRGGLSDAEQFSIPI